MQSEHHIILCLIIGLIEGIDPMCVSIRFLPCLFFICALV